MSVDPRYPAVLAERYHLPDPLARCTCTHAASLHRIGERSGDVVRTRCTACDADGPCGCRRYQPKGGEPR